jgi:uncharacterized membrane protein YbhN (UPF0104 family)
MASIMALKPETLLRIVGIAVVNWLTYVTRLPCIALALGAQVL